MPVFVRGLSEEILFIFKNTEHAARAVVQPGSVETH